MSFKGKYILIAIDGTDSKKLSDSQRLQSHIYKFYKEFYASRGVKKYVNGPDVSGMGVESITEQCSIYVNSMIRIFLDERTTKPFYRLPKSSKFFLENKGKKRLRIVIVGHSRGGLIAIKLSKRLHYPVYFLGLYDAVEMYSGEKITDAFMHRDTTEIINVQKTFHAIRDYSMNSRKVILNWANVGEGYKVKLFRSLMKNQSNLKSDGLYEPNFFKTSHAGINGLVVLNPSRPFLDDFGCDESARDPGIKYSSGRLFVDEKRTQKLARECVLESLSADLWMRDMAGEHGLQFSQ